MKALAYSLPDGSLCVDFTPEPLAEHPDGLARAKQLATPGLCLFCEEPISGKRRVVCSEKECKAAYLRAWHRDQRVRTPERYGPAFYREKAQAAG